MDSEFDACTQLNYVCDIWVDYCEMSNEFDMVNGYVMTIDNEMERKMNELCSTQVSHSNLVESWHIEVELVHRS